MGSRSSGPINSGSSMVWQRSDVQCPQCGAEGRPEAHNPLWLQRGLLKAGDAVNDQAFDATSANRLEQPMGKFIQDVLARRIPEELHIAALFRCGKAETHCFGLQKQAFRRFIAAEQQARFADTRRGQNWRPRVVLPAPKGPTTAPMVAAGRPP
jgi:hypothetical protein